MFGLFKKKPFKPPSKNQVVLCAQLGLEITKKMSREDVSNLLSLSLKKEKYKKIYDEVHRAEDEEFEKLEREKYGDELCDELNKWEKYCKSSDYYILMFKRSGKILVDIAEFEFAEIVGERSHAIQVGIILPKRHKDKDFGDYIEWEKYITLKPNQILKTDLLSKPFDEYDIESYELIKKQYISNNLDKVGNGKECFWD